MMIVRIRLYSSKGQPVGDLEVPAANARVWLDQQDQEDQQDRKDQQGQQDQRDQQDHV